MKTIRDYLEACDQRGKINPQQFRVLLSQVALTLSDETTLMIARTLREWCKDNPIDSEESVI